MADTGGRIVETLVPQAPQPATFTGRPAPIEAFESLRRRFWAFLAAAAIGFALVAAYAFLTPARYTSAAQLLISTKDRAVVDDLRGAAAPAEEAAAVETQTEIFRTRTMTGRVVDRLNLTRDARMNPVFGTDEQADIQRELTIDAVQASLAARRIGLTNLVEVAYTATDPKLAAAIAQAYAEEFLAQQIEAKSTAVERDTAWINERLAVMREELIAKERAVEAYRAQQGLFDAAGAPLPAQTLVQINLELIAARADLAEREARLRGLKGAVDDGAADVSSAAEALASPVVSQLRAQQAEVARRRAELATRYGPRHPEIQNVENEATDIDKRIQDEIARIAANLSNEVSIARRRVESIEESLDNQRAGVAVANVGGVRLRELERDAEASRELYTAFLERARQLTEQAGLAEANARIVAPATAPISPSFPNKKLMLVLAAIAGVALGGLLVWVLEALERTVRRSDDIEARLGVRFLGATPFLTRSERTFDGEIAPAEDYVVKRAVSPYAEGVRAIRAALAFSDPSRGLARTIAITSPMPAEGKTTLAISLARVAALSGVRVALVDCDLRRRSASNAIGIETDHGLFEVLSGKCLLGQAIHQDPQTPLKVVPLTANAYQPNELLGSDAMRALIEALKRDFDLVVLDTAPVLPIADTRILCSFADAVLVSCRWGHTRLNALRDALDLISRHDGRIAGVAIQQVGTSPMSRMLYDSRDYYADLYDTYYTR